MSDEREKQLQDLKAFLRTIQKPDKPVESVDPEDSLVESGLIDSLAIIQIVMYLEETYDINFVAGGVDPERLASMASILDLVTEMRQ